jgi:hypothetical protein
MGIAYHTLYAADGLGLNVADRAYVGTVSVTYAATSGTAAATAAVTWTEPVPTPYCAVPCMKEQANFWFTSMVSTGFTFNIAGLASLSGATIEVAIFA